MSRNIGDRGGKDALSDAQKAKQKKVLAALLKHPDNRQCADCEGRSPPTWASVNIGVFVCLTCSGIHRSLGVHISQVRSATLDTWLPAQVMVLAKVGNRRANLYYEKQLPPGMRRPNPNDTERLKDYIIRKYQHKDFADTSRNGPITADEEEASPSATATTSKAPPVPAPVPTAAPPVSAPVPAPAPAPLLDLLSLDDPAPAPVATANTVATTAVSAGTSWATFDDTPAAPSAPAPIATASIDLFGGLSLSPAAAPAPNTGFIAPPPPAADAASTASVPTDPFGSFTAPPTPPAGPAATAVGSNGVANFADFDSAPTSVTSAPPPQQQFPDLLGTDVTAQPEPAKPQVAKSDILNLYSAPSPGMGMGMGMGMQPQVGMYGGVQGAHPQTGMPLQMGMQPSMHGMHGMQPSMQGMQSMYGQPQSMAGQYMQARPPGQMTGYYHGGAGWPLPMGQQQMGMANGYTQQHMGMMQPPQQMPVGGMQPHMGHQGQMGFGFQNGFNNMGRQQ